MSIACPKCGWKSTVISSRRSGSSLRRRRRCRKCDNRWSTLEVDVGDAKLLQTIASHMEMKQILAEEQAP